MILNQHSYMHSNILVCTTIYVLLYSFGPEKSIRRGLYPQNWSPSNSLSNNVYDTMHYNSIICCPHYVTVRIEEKRHMPADQDSFPFKFFPVRSQYFTVSRSENHFRLQLGCWWNHFRLLVKLATLLSFKKETDKSIKCGISFYPG